MNNGRTDVKEPVLRGIRLTAVGEVKMLARTALPSTTRTQVPDQRRICVTDAWHDAAVYDLRAVLLGVPDDPADQ